MLRLPDPSRLSTDFHKRGFTLVAGCVSARDLTNLHTAAVRAVASCSVRIDRGCAAARLSYDVLTGEVVQRQLSELFNLYRSTQLIDWLRGVTNSAVTFSSHLRSSINVNYLHRIGQQYPWHYDASPYTAVLFLSSTPPTAGGQLLIRDLTNNVEQIQPRAGDLLVMDGSRCQHAVAALRQNVNRVTVPMVYPVGEIERPSGLDEYLYGHSVRATGKERRND